MATTIDYSPFEPEVQDDPYPFYEELRRGPAATHIAADDIWAIPHFEHVWHIARAAPDFSSKAFKAIAVGAVSIRHGERPDIHELDRKMATSLIASDPPEHTRLRRLVSKPFTPRMINELATDIHRIAHECVDELLAANERGEADLVGHVNMPLPVLAIASALGIPAERRDDFKRWSDALVGQLDAAPTRQADVPDIAEMNRYFAELIPERMAAPGDDLISWILAGTTDSDQPLTTRELVAFCTLLLAAGNETTTNLLSNAFLGFFDNPDQMEAMRAAPDLAPVVEEALRYDSPVQAVVRLANHDVEIGDVVIPEDAMVLILYGSANRDETRWADAGRFDVTRPVQDHVAFGSGIHHCLGAHLARLEATIVLDVLRTRLASIEPAGPATRAGAFMLRGAASIPVRVEAA